MHVLLAVTIYAYHESHGRMVLDRPVCSGTVLQSDGKFSLVKAPCTDRLSERTVVFSNGVRGRIEGLMPDSVLLVKTAHPL